MYELYIRFSNGKVVRETLCSFKEMRIVKQCLLVGESDYILKIKPMRYF